MKQTMIIMMVSLIISLPMALQSGTIAEARLEGLTPFELAAGNLAYETSVEASNVFPCIDKLLLADYYFYQYLNCLDDPECANSHELFLKLAAWVYYENELQKCLNPI
jgi:hypothetical protein